VHNNESSNFSINNFVVNCYYLNRITNNSHRLETAMRVAMYSIWQILKLFCQPEYLLLLNYYYNSLPCHSICCFLVSADHLMQMWKYNKVPVIQYRDIWNSHPTSKNCKENFPLLRCYSKQILFFHMFTHHTVVLPAATRSTTVFPSSQMPL
jgi:hypothetical protein